VVTQLHLSSLQRGTSPKTWTFSEAPHLRVLKLPRTTLKLKEASCKTW